jgi:hypothetical protein
MKCWDCLERILCAERQFVLALIDNCNFGIWLDIICVCLLCHSMMTVVIAFREVRSLQIQIIVNPLNAELNPICRLLALLGGATIVVVSRLRGNVKCDDKSKLQES